MLRVALALMLAAMVTAPALAWEPQEFLVLLDGPMNVGPPTDADDALAQDMAKQGFTVAMWDAGKLDLCRKYGLKLAISAYPEWALLAHQVQDHPALWGYYLTDEPSEEQWPNWLSTIEGIRLVDPAHPWLINLTGGANHRRFIEALHPDLLSYDYYQWWWGRDSFFPLLEDHRASALAAGIPLFCWFEPNTNPETQHDDNAVPPPDNAQKVRQSVYSSLAYGVKGVQWFNFWMIYTPGTTAMRPWAQESVAVINHELKRLGPTLIRLTSTEVFHTGDLPGGCRALPADWWVQTRTPDLVLGFFQHRDDPGHEYLMVANKSVEQRRWTVLHFTRPVRSVEKLDRSSGEWTALDTGELGGSGAVAFILAPGDGELLRVK